MGIFIGIIGFALLGRKSPPYNVSYGLKITSLSGTTLDNIDIYGNTSRILLENTSPENITLINIVISKVDDGPMESSNGEIFYENDLYVDCKLESDVTFPLILQPHEEKQIELKFKFNEIILDTSLDGAGCRPHLILTFITSPEKYSISVGFVDWGHPSPDYYLKSDTKSFNYHLNPGEMAIKLISVDKYYWLNGYVSTSGMSRYYIISIPRTSNPILSQLIGSTLYQAQGNYILFYEFFQEVENYLGIQIPIEQFIEEFEHYVNGTIFEGFKISRASNFGARYPPNDFYNGQNISGLCIAIINEDKAKINAYISVTFNYLDTIPG
jgi:hypothetical protein